ADFSYATRNFITGQGVRAADAEIDNCALCNQWSGSKIRARRNVGAVVPALLVLVLDRRRDVPFHDDRFPAAVGTPSEFKSVIIPLRMNFVFFGANADISHSFEPAPAV